MNRLQWHLGAGCNQINSQIPPYFAPHIGWQLFRWTSTQPIYMRTWKEPYKSSNQRVFLMDQAECVYFKGSCMASKNREENASFNFQICWYQLDSKSVHASWLKMKFSFSSMLMTSWLCEKQSRPMKNLEICWSGSKIKNVGDQTHSRCPCGVCKEWDYTLLNASISTKSYVLYPSTKETRSIPQWSSIRLQESFWNLKMKNSNLICTATSLEVWCSSIPGQDHILLTAFPILFKSRSNTLNIGSRSTQLPQNILQNPLFL